MNKKCEKCNVEWEVGLFSTTQSYYVINKHKGESGNKTLCQTCFQQDRQTYFRDWEFIQEYDKDKGFPPKELKVDYRVCYAGVVDEIEDEVLNQSKCYHCNPWKVEPEQRKRMKKLQKNRKDLHWEEKRELEALERRYNESNKDSGQNEAKIQQLRTQIAELEAATNRTAEQEQELQDKKKELEDLKKETKSSSSNFWENYKGWIIGGGIILVLLIILGIVFGGKKKRKQY